jgi:hypothetical protein
MGAPWRVLRQLRGDEDSRMTLDDFRKSLTATDAPADLTHALAGLWWDAKGDWTRAHESAQQDEAEMIRGFMLTSTARRAIRTTRHIGIVALATRLPGAARCGVDQYS